ncbi:MAG: EAL domain-containing protein [Microcystaceae cyanobacterium]
MSSPVSQTQQKSVHDSDVPQPAPWMSWRKAWPVLLLALAITTGLWVIRKERGLQFLELTAYDHLHRLSSRDTWDSRLLIVGIEEKDLQIQQEGELSDKVVAQLLETLQEEKPAVIGLDIFRDVPHPPGEAALAQALKADNIIVANQLSSDSIEGVSPPPNIPDSRVGFVDLLIDPDNVVRRYLLYGQSSDGIIQVYSFALQVSRQYLKHKKERDNLEVLADSLKFNSLTLPKLSSNAGGYQLPLSEALGWQALLKYQSPQLARQISLEQALNREFEPQWIKDKVILIGYVAPSKKDTFPTPYSAVQINNFEMPGVTIHGVMVSQLLRGVLDGERALWFWPQWGEFLWLFGGALVGGLLVCRFNHPISLGLAIMVGIGGIWGTCFILFQFGGWIPSVPPILGLVLTGGVVLARKAIYRSYHDSLTDLPNRRLFLQKLQKMSLQQSKTDEERLTVLFLDIDRFNKVNAALGHQAGDQLLKVLAYRLQNFIKQYPSLLGRVGGDEFALCLRSQMSVTEINTLVDQMHKELSATIPWHGQEIRNTFSIGIAYDQPKTDFNAAELLRYADIAMNRAKNLGKDRHELYFPGMDTEATERWELETDLWAALKKNEFQMYYQPIITLHNRRIAGFEALIRWQSPKRGFVSPGAFIPVTEETGLIIELGQWILRESCSQMQEWHEMFPQDPPLIMSVNLSGRQFNQPNLVGQIQKILTDLNVSSQSLKLEITESMMMNDVEKAINLLKQLKSLGLRLSIDDFGTGYSSLSYLHRFPVDTLKIDRSFVNRMEIGNDNSKYSQIVRTVISLGHNLDLDVIAEGIETSDQATALQGLDCEYGQGYFFAKPLSKEAATELLRNPPQW